MLCRRKRKALPTSSRTSFVASVLVTSLFGGSVYGALDISPDQTKLPATVNGVATFSSSVTLDISPTQKITAGNLVIPDGVTVKLTGFGLFQFNSIQIQGSGYLDIGQCGLRITGMDAAQVDDLVKVALDTAEIPASPKVPPKGLYSSVAASDSDKTVLVYNNRAGGPDSPVASSILSNYFGEPTSPSDVLSFVTYFGDLNGDGKVTPADQLILTENLGTSGATYLMGDLNRDDQIDKEDWDLVDALVYRDLPQIAPSVTGGGVENAQASIFVSSFIPEPTGSLAVLSGLATLAIRRAHRNGM